MIRIDIDLIFIIITLISSFHIFIIKIDNAYNLKYIIDSTIFFIFDSYNNLFRFNLYNFFSILIYFSWFILININSRFLIILKLINLKNNDRILIIYTIYNYIFIFIFDIMIFFYKNRYFSNKLLESKYELR